MAARAAASLAPNRVRRPASHRPRQARGPPEPGRGHGDNNLVDWLRQYLGRPYVGLVHRLDRNTSGLLIVGKRTKAAQRLTESLQQGRLERRYLAWVEGELRAPVAWRHWLLKDERTNTVRVVREGASGAKAAALGLEPRARGSWRGHAVTLVELTLETGRSHRSACRRRTRGIRSWETPSTARSSPSAAQPCTPTCCAWIIRCRMR